MAELKFCPGILKPAVDLKQDFFEKKKNELTLQHKSRK
jgi:hypothetical protein